MLRSMAYRAVTAACTTAVVRALQSASFPAVAGGYLATVLVPGALGATFVFPPPASKGRRAVAALLVSACSLDVDCF